METNKLSYQTDKFILKCDVKNGIWYVALQNKETTETMVKNFKTQKKAEAYFGKIMGLKPNKTKSLKVVKNAKTT